MIKTKDQKYHLSEIEAESKDYAETMEYVNELWSQGYIVDLVTGSKKGNEHTPVYFITAFKRTPIV